ncbi:MAG: signal recognition particle protein [Acidaminococcales bacterium]|jgi:signal recognition particle subunit SRP54|nr:signal recognition particle protein [Acidaminococcales bacterium]
MAFDGLSEKLTGIFKKLRSKGKLTEKEVGDALREVRVALLEADVNFKVAKDFIAKIKERAVGQEVLASLTPTQQVIKIVNEELTLLMGGAQSKIAMSSRPPTVIMLVGLQGSGKTTSAGKLAKFFAADNKKPLLAAADVYRPAAVRQLQILGEQLGLPVFSMDTGASPVEIAENAVKQSLLAGRDIVILDTAGRLHIDEQMMRELQDIKAAVKPQEILLAVDAMTGQDAVTVAEAFNGQLGVDGIVLTKLDGDARGGAALSVKAVTGRPIKFVGVGEKLDALEPFYPDRMASRILGMGDVLGLIEKIGKTVDLEKAQELEKKLRKEEFTLEQFLEQMQQIKKLGSLKSILGMIPGISGKLKDTEVDEKEIAHVEAIIQSMTRKERRDPRIINGGRRKRIALGSGTKVQDVNRLLKKFEESRKLMKQLQGMSSFSQKGILNKLPFMK